MIKSARVSTLAVAWAGILLVVGAPSCSRGPESFCQSWADDACTAVSGCCTGSTRFDVETCKIRLTGSCQDGLDLPRIHGGEVVFDRGAASDCLGTTTSCADLQNTEDRSFDHQAACANVITGFRPAGTGCDSSSDCARGGAYPTCYRGIFGGDGVCAKVVLSDDGTCGFSFDSDELRACPDGTFCDTSGVKTNPNAPPSVATHEFTAPCRKNPGAGASCFDNDSQSVLTCADGLFCDFGAGNPVCKARKSKGQSCNDDGECAAGLGCAFDESTFTSRCGSPPGSFCFAPAKCGDDICEGSENEINCPQDCGGGSGGFGGFGSSVAVGVGGAGGGFSCLGAGDACDPSFDECCNFCDAQVNQCF
jgi:hypothetical protein